MGSVVPTRVGMVRWQYILLDSKPVVPTRVGMDRSTRTRRAGASTFSPHAWGWSAEQEGRGSGSAWARYIDVNGMRVQLAIFAVLHFSGNAGLMRGATRS